MSAMASSVPGSVSKMMSRVAPVAGRDASEANASKKTTSRRGTRPQTQYLKMAFSPERALTTDD
jgi:hypothetical protein